MGGWSFGASAASQTASGLANANGLPGHAPRRSAVVAEQPGSIEASGYAHSLLLGPSSRNSWKADAIRRFYPLLIAAILFVGSTVNKTERFARRLWNPVRCFGTGEPVLARARDPDGAAEAEWKAAGQKARMNWWAEVEAGIERDREQRKQLKEKLSQLSTREQVVTALTNQDKDAAALQLAIGHEVARFVWFGGTCSNGHACAR
eukprot:COSAG04_NODE_2815_length_3539_cov_20.339535_2_plen_205_part_00